MIEGVTTAGYYKRMKRDGYTVEEAHLIPKRMPRWVWLVEQEEGMPIKDVILRERRHGQSDAQIAASFGVHKDTLGHWLRKWGISNNTRRARA